MTRWIVSQLSTIRESYRQWLNRFSRYFLWWQKSGNKVSLKSENLPNSPNIATSSRYPGHVYIIISYKLLYDVITYPCHDKIYMQLTRSHHWFRWWLGIDQVPSHFLNQCWPVTWMYVFIMSICQYHNWYECCFYVLFFSESIDAEYAEN